MNRLILALWLLATLHANLHGTEPHYRPAKVLRVIDGDTIVAEIVLATEAEIGNEVAIKASCRLYGINAPDTKPDGAAKQKAATENLRKLVADNCKDGAFQAELRGRDKYGRILCRIISNGVDLNQKQIDDGFAVVYLP